MKSMHNIINLRLPVNYYLALALLASSSILLVACGGSGSTSALVPVPVQTPPPAINSTPSASPNANKMGINIGAPLDFESDGIYADVIKTSRDFIAGTNENNTVLVATDTDGWPMADFSFYVWGSVAKRHGTYTLSFKGKAVVTSNPSIPISITYDSANNTSTGTFNYTNTASAAFALKFASTQQTSTSAIGTGVKDIKLMRPDATGSATSYPSTTLFTTPIKTLVSKFSVIRFMDFLATNKNPQILWSDRPKPTWASFNRYSNTPHANGNGYGWQGIGGPLEHAIMFANETGRHAWINIPVQANDAYVTNVANMLAYGSDGVNPYTSVQPTPKYPPLNQDLHFYIEYSNELWNSQAAFQQFYDNCKLASAELVATAAAGGTSPLNWDGAWSAAPYNSTPYVSGGTNTNWNYSMCWRRPGKRTVEISNIFRSVFGDPAMTDTTTTPRRVRIVMMTQLTASGRMLYDESKMLFEYYNQMAGTFTTTPPQPAARPPSYYIYAAGGSGYYDPKDPSVASATALFDDLGMLPPGYLGNYGSYVGIRPSVQADVKYTAALGVKRIAYEGGPNLETGVNVTNYAVTSAAVSDARMKTAMINMHDEWSANSGELFVYYRATGDAQWGFTSDVSNLGTFKFAAIDALNLVDRSPITFGTLFPGSLAGTAASVCSKNNSGCSGSSSFSVSGGGTQPWQSYTFRSAASATWTVTLTLSNPVNSTVAVYVDGVQVETTKPASGTVIFNAGTVGAGIHGVIVRAVTGSFTLSSVAVN